MFAWVHEYQYCSIFKNIKVTANLTVILAPFYLKVTAIIQNEIEIPTWC